MKLTDEQREEIENAVIDMAIADWPMSAGEMDQYASRVTWWLENRDDIKGESA